MPKPNPTYTNILAKRNLHTKQFESALLALDEICRTDPDFWDQYDGQFRQALEMINNMNEVQ